MNETFDQPINHLLSNVSLIREKYDAIAKLTGENFNIFSVLKLETDEVRLHSRFIGELLNPKSSHNQNELFLTLFISVIGLEEYQYTKEQIKNATVLIEENIGGIPDDYSKGGRIDLVIKFPNNAKEIVIENKIWAGDQYRQLNRYYKEYKNSNIIYLTPYPKEPSKESLGELELSSVKCITYKTHIKKWIELCQKEIVDKPYLKEILSHYLNIVTKLTNQSKYHEMKEEIEKLITNDLNYFKSANDISNTFNVLITKLSNDTMIVLKNKFFKTFGDKFKKDYNKVFDNNLVLFSYEEEYEFRLRLADEQGISIWLAPDKKGSILGVANEKPIVKFKNCFVQLKEYKIEENNNYTAWIISKNNFIHWSIDDKFKLTKPDFVEEITDKIIYEVELFINAFKDQVEKEGINNIDYNF